MYLSIVPLLLRLPLVSQPLDSLDFVVVAAIVFQLVVSNVYLLEYSTKYTIVPLLILQLITYQTQLLPQLHLLLGNRSLSYQRIE